MQKLVLNRIVIFSLIFQIFVVKVFSQTNTKDEYLTAIYDQVHGTPAQLKYRKLAPMPIGTVYIQRLEHGEKEMRQHFRLMKKLGFNALKQIMVCPGTTLESVQRIALDEGICPFWYENGGWELPTPDLLKKLGIPTNATPEQIRTNKAMLAYQLLVYKKRLTKLEEYAKANNGAQPKERSTAYEPEVGPRGFELSEKGKKLFLEWVKKQYSTIDEVNKVYNQRHANISTPEGSVFTSWEDFDNRWELMADKEYRHLRDILRFKADHGLEGIKNTIEKYKEFDANAAFRGGGEMSLFYPHAWWGVDMESVAEVMDNAGCFYPSMHLAWHYNEVNHETTLPFYMQAAQMQDFFKGGWAAAIEATGGPQQFSGYKEGAGFTVNEGIMTQFLLSQVAAGFKGFGLWCWNNRSAGWEAGEYALLDRNDQPTDRAVKAGQIGKTLLKYRDEIWSLRKEPTVGLFIDWDNDAIWAAMSKSGRDKFKQDPVNARIGAARALINANVPYEYVTPKDLAKGLAGRYKVIYMPAILSMNPKTIAMLNTYVKNGGRVVADLPTAWYDQNAALMATGVGSDFEKLFGVTLNDFQYSGVNFNYTLQGMLVNGFTADLSLTSSKSLARYGNNYPAVTENKLGKGTAVIIGFEAGTSCFKPGNTQAEKMLIDFALGSNQSPYKCEGAIAYRLAGEKADHYFLINDTEKEVGAKLSFTKAKYNKVIDAITNEDLSLTENITVLPNSGRWVRFEK